MSVSEVALNPTTVTNAFDVAVGMSAAQLDAIGAALLAQAPQLFSGTQTSTIAGVAVEVSWAIEQPATFDLSGEGGAALSFTYPVVTIGLHAEGVPDTAIATPLTAQAQVVPAAGSLRIDVTGVSAPPQPDPVADDVVQRVIVPQILASAGQIFGAVTIPPVTLPGIELTELVPVVQQGALVAVANMMALAVPREVPLGFLPRGAQVGGQPGVPPSPPVGFPWPASPFFVLFGEALMQRLATTGTPPFSLERSEESGPKGFRETSHFTLGTGALAVSIDGAGLAFSTQLTGRIHLEVDFLFIETGVDLDVYSEPQLSGTLSLTPSGNQLLVQAASVNDFRLYFKPAGEFSSRITGAMLSAIFDAFSAIAHPDLTGYLNGIRFASYEIPAYEVAVSGVTVTATPAQLSVSNVEGMLAVTGQVQIGS